MTNLNRVLCCLLVAMIAFSLFFGWRLKSMPELDQDLILNEASYYRMLNQKEHEGIAEMNASILARSKNSASSFFLKCRKEAKTFESLFLNHSKKMTKVMESQHLHKPKLDLKGVIEVHNSMVKNFNGYNKSEQLRLDTIVFTDIEKNELTNLGLYRYEKTLLDNYELTIDNRLRECSGIYCSWFSIESIFLSKFGKRSIHDTLQVTIPNPMIAAKRERVQIRFSKKFIDKLADSIRSSGIVNSTLRNPFYVNLEMECPNFQIIPFDGKKQAISNSNYTNWEFDLTPKTSGIANPILVLGIIFKDDSDKDVIETLKFPLNEITILD
jgi:hypothetical protein